MAAPEGPDQKGSLWARLTKWVQALDLAPYGSVLLGAYLLTLGVALTSLLLRVWPAVEPPVADAYEIPFTLFTLQLTGESSMVLLVLVVGAIGSYIHAATSFVTYVGNKRLEISWFWWYVLRPGVGATLALVSYTVLRGGLVALNDQMADGELNRYTIAAFAGLNGLFSKQAIDKLREVFDTLFKGKGDEERQDKLTNPKPSVESVDPDPSPLRAGMANGALVVRGTGFMPGTWVRVNEEARDCTFEASERIRVVLTATDLAAASTINLVVVNPPPGGGESDVKTVTVEP